MFLLTIIILFRDYNNTDKVCCFEVTELEDLLHNIRIRSINQIGNPLMIDDYYIIFG